MSQNLFKKQVQQLHNYVSYELKKCTITSLSVFNELKMLLTMGVPEGETVLVTSRGKNVTSVPPRRRRLGFSLPELLVAVGLLSILSAVAMPYFISTLRNSDFNAAVRQVASDARFARSLAVSKGGYYRLQTSNNSYRVEHCNPCTPPVLVSWPASSAQMGASADVISNWQDLSSLYGGVTIQSVSTVDGAIFNSTGASVGPGNDPVTPRSVSITLRKPDGTTKVIQADPAGNVKMP